VETNVNVKKRDKQSDNCCVFKNGMNFKLNQNMEHCMNLYSNTSTMQWRSRWSVFSMHVIVWGYCVLQHRANPQMKLLLITLYNKPSNKFADLNRLLCKLPTDALITTVKSMGLFGGIWNENAVNLYLEVWISWILCLVMKQHMVSPVWIDFVFFVWSFHLEIEILVTSTQYPQTITCIEKTDHLLLHCIVEVLLYKFIQCSMSWFSWHLH
jgi:hypothetical protein